MKAKKKRVTKFDKAASRCVALGCEKTFRMLFASGAIDYRRLTIAQMTSMARTVDSIMDVARKESFAEGYERGKFSWHV